MAYSDIAALRNDNDFVVRVTACAAVEEKESTDGANDPNLWVADRMWAIAAAPGFGDKYAYAVEINVPRPGNDQSVISDAEILAVVQPME
jgi:hypothetical protein